MSLFTFSDTKEENYRAYKLFSMMDIDGGGSISLREIKRVLMGEAVRFVSCSFDHPDSGLLYELDEENCVVIADIESDSIATKFPFLINRMRLFRINDFKVQLYDARSLQKVYQELVRLGDDPVELDFVEPLIVINKFSCVLDIEVNQQIYSVELPVGAVYNHKIFVDKIGELMDEVSPVLNNIIIEFIEHKRQIIFRSVNKNIPFRLLFQSGPNFRRSCRYALGFSAEDLPYSLEHIGQPLLMDLSLGLTEDKMEVLMVELFQQFDRDGSGEFEFEEFRDFYIKYLDNEESLKRLRDYATYRFRDIERERFVKAQQLERLNKYRRKQYLKEKEANTVRTQREKFLEDSYVDQYGIRRRKFKHRTISRGPSSKKIETSDDVSSHEGASEEEVEDEEIRKSEMAKIENINSKEVQQKNAETLSLEEKKGVSEDEENLPPARTSLPKTTDISEEPQPFQEEEEIRTQKRRIRKKGAEKEGKVTGKISALEIERIPPQSPSAPLSPKSLSEAPSMISNLTKEEYQYQRQLKSREKRKATKQRLHLQQQRRKKILAQIYQANAELKKQEIIQKHQEEENAVSSTMMELHARVKRALIESLKTNPTEYELIPKFSIDYSHVLTSPAVTVTPAIFGKSIQSDAIAVEDLPSSQLHPAGKFYYFLKEDHENPLETFNSEYIHPVYFNADFVRHPTRHSSAALAMISSIKHACDEGISYRALHGMKRVTAIPPEDVLPKKSLRESNKKVRFLEPENISKWKLGLLARLTINTIKLTNLVSVHLVEKNSPFATLHCGDWKSSTQIYSYAGSDCSWDDLNWTFRLHKKDILTMTVYSGTNLSHYPVGTFSITSREIMKLPVDHNSLITIKGQLFDYSEDPHPAQLRGNRESSTTAFLSAEDPTFSTIATSANKNTPNVKAHRKGGRATGKFEITIFMEKGQEWDWYIKDYMVKKSHLVEMKHEIAMFSKSYKPKDGDEEDRVQYPMYLEIDRILVVDVKTVHWFQKNKLYIILDAGVSEVSTIDENPIIGNIVQDIDQAAEWKNLNWNILITKPELNLIFKIYSSNIPVGRFILTGKTIFEKVNKDKKEFEFYGDIFDWKDQKILKGRITINAFYHTNTDLNKRRASKKQKTNSSFAYDDFYQMEDMEAVEKKIVKDLDNIQLPALVRIEQIEVFPFDGKDGNELTHADIVMSCCHITYEKEAKRIYQKRIIKNLQWAFPLNILMNIHISVAWNRKHTAAANIRSDIFRTVKKSTNNNSFTHKVFIHNETAICGYIILAGKVEFEGDYDKISQLLEQSELILLAKDETNRNLPPSFSVLSNYLLPVDKILSNQKSKSYIDEKIAIPWKDIELIDILTSTNFKDYVNQGVNLLITDVVLSDLKSKHFIKKNSPKVSFLINAEVGESTSVLENAGREAIWSGLQILLPIESTQSLKVIVESNKQNIGEITVPFEMLVLTISNEIGQRELHSILASKGISLSSANQLTVADEMGKIQIKYQLLTRVVPVVETSNLNMRLGISLQFPILVVIHNISVLDLKQVHRFQKNSPYIKIARMSRRQNDVLMSRKLNSAGSYGKWYNLFWEVILDDSSMKIYLQALSDSMIIGSGVIESQGLLEVAPNKLGLSEIDCQLLGTDNMNHVGNVRLLYSLEPYVDEASLLNSEAGETSVNSMTPRSLLDSVQHKESLSEILDGAVIGQKWIHVNEITVILNQSLSSETLQLFRDSHVQLLCGKYVQGIELFTTPNEYIMHNKKMQVTFSMNQDFSLLLTIFSEGTVKGREERSELGQCSISLSSILRHATSHESKEGTYIIDRDFYYGDKLMGLLLISCSFPEIIPSSALVEDVAFQIGEDSYFSSQPSVVTPGGTKRRKTASFQEQEELIRSDHPFWIQINRILINNLTPPTIITTEGNRTLHVDRNFHAEELLLMINYDQYEEKVPCSHHAGWKVMEWEALNIIYYITNSIDIWEFSIVFDAYFLGKVTITVNDWNMKSRRSNYVSKEKEKRNAFNHHQFELFAKIEKDGQVVGKMILNFQKNRLFHTSTQSLLPHPTKYQNKGIGNPNLRNDDDERSLGHLRVKYLAVRNLIQIYDLFPNSPKVFFCLGSYEYQTDIAYHAGSDHTWDNLNWGRIPFFPNADLTIKVVSNNEIIGKLGISHQEMRQLLTDAKSILTIDRPLFDGILYKGNIELSFFGEILPAALEGEEEQEVGEFNKVYGIEEVDDKASTVLSTILTHDSLNKDALNLSLATATPSLTDILFLGISLTELKKIDVVQLNSPQVIVTCGDWQQVTSRAFYAGSSASWLFRHRLDTYDVSNKWRLSVKGSPFIRITVVSNKRQIGSSHFMLRELLSMPSDEIGLIRSIHRLESVDNAFAGFVELCFKIVSLTPNERTQPSVTWDGLRQENTDTDFLHYPSLIDQRQSRPLHPSLSLDAGGSLSGYLLSASIDGGKEYLNVTDSLLNRSKELAENEPISLLDNGEDSPESETPLEEIQRKHNSKFTPIYNRSYGFPLMCSVVSIYFENIRRQIWLKNESFSFTISNEYSSKSSSLKVIQKGGVVKVENVYWQYRFIHPDNILRLDVYSQGKLITSVSTSAAEIINQEKSSQGFLEIVRFLFPQDPQSGKVILSLSLTSLAPEQHNRVEQIENILEMQSTTEVSQVILPKLQKEYRTQILLTVNFKVVAAQEISRMFHECVISLVITDCGRYSSKPILNPAGVLIYDCATLIPPVKLHERSYVKIIVEDKYKMLVGCAIFTINDFLSVPVDEKNDLAVLYSPLTLGIVKSGLISFAFDKFEGDVDLGPYVPPSQRVEIKTIINPDSDTKVIELPQISNNSKLTIVSIEVKDLKSIHKYGKNSPLVQLEYFGVRFMSQCIPFAGESANWDNLFWNITCREKAVLKFRISSGSVSIGIVYIPMKELFTLLPNIHGDVIVTKDIMKDITSTNLYSQNYNTYNKSKTKHGVATFTIRHLSWQFKPKLLSTLHDQNAVDGGPSLETMETSLKGSGLEGGVSVQESILQRNIEQFQKLGIGAVLNRFEDSVKSILSMTDSFPQQDSSLMGSDSLLEFEKPLQVLSPPAVSPGSSFHTSSQAPEMTGYDTRDDRSEYSVSNSTSASQSSFIESDSKTRFLSGTPTGSSFSGTHSFGGDHTLSPSLPLSSFASRDSQSGTAEYSGTYSHSQISRSEEDAHSSNLPRSFWSSNTTTNTVPLNSRPKTSRGLLDVSDRNSLQPSLQGSSHLQSLSIAGSTYSENSSNNSTYPSYTSKNPSGNSISSANISLGGKVKIRDHTPNILPSITEYSTSSETNPPVLQLSDEESVSFVSQDKLMESEGESSKSEQNSSRSTNLRTSSHISAPVLRTVPRDHHIYRRFYVSREKIAKIGRTRIFSHRKICAYTAYQFVNTILTRVVSSFVALAEGEDFLPTTPSVGKLEVNLPVRGLERRSTEVFITAVDYVESLLQEAVTKIAIHLFLDRRQKVMQPTVLPPPPLKISNFIPSTHSPPCSPDNLQGISKKRKGILMKSEKMNEVERNRESAELFRQRQGLSKDAPFKLERAIINGVEQLIPQKSRITVLDIIGIDISGIDLRIIPTRPYLTACKPYGNWSGETNPVKIDLTPEAIATSGKDLFILNYYNVSVRYKWDPCILRRGQEIVFNLHDANSGLIFGKCIFPYEKLYKLPVVSSSIVNNLSASYTASSATDQQKLSYDDELISTNYLLFQIANEYGGGTIGGVVRFHIDLSVNRYEFTQHPDEFFAQHRSQHWGVYPLPPITYGMIRQRYAEIAEQYDNQEIVHPSLFGMKIRFRGHVKDESKFIHPIFRNYNLAKRTVFHTSLNLKGNSSSAVAKHNALLKKSKPNPFRWDPADKERGTCVVCGNGVTGCPRCFMMPQREDGGFYYPAEFAYDPELERKKLMEMEKKLIEMNIQKSRQLQKIDYVKQLATQEASMRTEMEEEFVTRSKGKKINDAESKTESAGTSAQRSSFSRPGKGRRNSDIPSISEGKEEDEDINERSETNQEEDEDAVSRDDRDNDNTTFASELSSIEELRDEVSKTYDRSSTKLSKTIQSLSTRHTKNSRPSITSISLTSSGTKSLTLSQNQSQSLSQESRNKKRNRRLSNASLKSSTTDESSVSTAIEEAPKIEFEDIDIDELMARERAKLPPFHTNLTTYAAIRNFRLMVQPTFNIYIKVFPTGYIKRLTCTAWDTIFQLYHMFNSNSSFGNAHSSMILLPLNTGLLEFHPELAFHTDLLMADKRGYDLLQDFRLNEPFKSYVLLYIQNYKLNNMLKLLEVYFNKNTVHQLNIEKLSIHTGNDKLPPKVSEDAVQQYLLKIISYEYATQQKDLINYYQILGKEYKKNFYTKGHRESYYEQLKQSFLEKAKLEETARLKAQLNKLQKKQDEANKYQVGPKKALKQSKALLERQLTKRKSQYFLQVDEQDQEDDRFEQDQSRRTKSRQSTPYDILIASAGGDFEDELSLSDIVLAEQKKYEKDRQKKDFSKLQQEERMFDHIMATGPEEDFLGDMEDDEEVEVISDIDDIDEIFQPKPTEEEKERTPITTSTPSVANSSDNIPADLPILITSRTDYSVSSLGSAVTSSFYGSEDYSSYQASAYTSEDTYRSQTSGSDYYYHDDDETSYIRSVLSNYSSSYASVSTKRSTSASSYRSSDTPSRPSTWRSVTSASFFTEDMPSTQRSTTSSLTFDTIDHVSLQSGGSVSSGSSSLFSGYRKSFLQQTSKSQTQQQQSQSRSWIHPSNTITNTLTSIDMYSNRNEPFSSSSTVASSTYSGTDYSSRRPSVQSIAPSEEATSVSTGGLFTYRSRIPSSHASDVSLNSTTYRDSDSVGSSVPSSFLYDQHQSYLTTDVSSQASSTYRDERIDDDDDFTSYQSTARNTARSTVISAITADSTSSFGDYKPSREDSFNTTRSSSFPSISQAISNQLEQSIHEYSAENLSPSESGSVSASASISASVSVTEPTTQRSRTSHSTAFTNQMESRDPYSRDQSTYRGSEVDNEDTATATSYTDTTPSHSRSTYDLASLKSLGSKTSFDILPPSSYSIQTKELLSVYSEGNDASSTFSFADERSEASKSTTISKSAPHSADSRYLEDSDGRSVFTGANESLSVTSAQSRFSSALPSISPSIRAQLTNSITEFTASNINNTSATSVLSASEYYRSNLKPSAASHSDESESTSSASLTRRSNSNHGRGTNDMETIHSNKYADDWEEEEDDQEEFNSLRIFDSQSLASQSNTSQSNNK